MNAYNSQYRSNSVTTKKKNIRKKVFKIDSTPMIYFSVSNFNLLITKLFSAT